MPSFLNYDWDFLQGDKQEKSKKNEKKNTKENSEYKQLSIFDVMNVVDSDVEDVSVSDIDRMILLLQSKKKEINAEERRKREESKQQAAIERRREQEEKERIRREQKAEEERLRREEKARREAEAKRKAEEHVAEVTSMELPMDWENFFDTDPSTIDVHVESIPDGFVKCLNTFGYVDIEYIASITGEDYKTVIKKLQGSIYQNPEKWGECFFKGWETAEEYLSGNVRHKLKVAKEENHRYNGYFKNNVKALKKVLPPSISAENIYVTLGSPWLPISVIEDFIYWIINDDEIYPIWDLYNDSYPRKYPVKHDEITGTWEFDFSYSDWTLPYKFRNKYGTSRRNGLEILLRTLNQQSVVITDSVKSPYTKSGKQTVINKNETVLAMEKQKLLISRFQEWIWSDKNRKKRLEELYEEKYASIKQRHFDGSFLELPGLDPAITLYPYQKNAVARILFSPNTLLAHDVGSGKTFIMIAAGMELKRLKMASKNLYVVPNNIVGQWRHIFYSMYPDAYIRCIEAKDFTPTKREATLEDIRDNDYDAVIMTYSCFSKIPISVKYRQEELLQIRQELEEISRDCNKSTKRLENRLEKVSDKTYELLREKEEEGVCFDQLGITRLFVDEAHNFKNVPIDTKIERVMGISSTGSAKCQDMMDKVHIVQHQNAGKGVIFATGTPITNSITDAYIMQSYLQSAELAILGLQSFDSWVGMFAEKSTNFEIDVDTSNYRMATRFAKFHNIPELTTMLATVADFHQMDETQGVPDHDGYNDTIVHKTRDFSRYLKYISERADDVRNGRVSRTDDNMLKITTDGRKAALDLRLIGDEYGFTTTSKVFMCAENVSQIYKSTTQDLSTQLVFCDTSTPKEGFNIYDELKGLLIKMGVPACEIAYVHDATTESKRESIFEDMRQGVIRVLIGSTFKLGLGVNVQNKLIALHHLDVPWRPADMVQREGRILRQGNENDQVFIYRYITEGSFDAYSWQLLETKQRFIADLLSGTADDRNVADVDDTVLNYAEVKALAVGNPLIKERVEVANELSKYLILQNKLTNQRGLYEMELVELPEKIERIEKLIPVTKEDAEFYAANKQEYTADERRDIRTMIYQASHLEEPTKEEVVATNYQGFEVVIPERVSIVHPVVILRRSGRYMVELGSSDIGGMTKIDRCLNDLDKRLEDLVKKLDDLNSRKAFMERELSKESDYSEDIDRCKIRLADIDHQLGVDKDD